MLSVCIIAKNEESNILRCINSVKSIADEIIVVDTGSTDKTVTVATSLGAKVFYKKWNNDFSEARNYAMEKATKEWIFSIDADEALDSNDVLKLKNILKNTKKEAVYLNLVNLIKNTPINEISSLRIFKNRTCYRYVGKLHEQIYFSIKENVGEDGFEVSDVKLNHYGYDHNNIDMSKKIERNIDVLNTYKENDKDGFYYFSLGSEYLKSNEQEKAMECFKIAEEKYSRDCGYKPYLAVSMIQIYLQNKKYKSGLECLERFKKQLPDFRELHFLEGALNSEMLRYSISYESLVRYIQTPIDTSKYPCFNFEESNDINGLINGLNTVRIEHDINTISTVIDLEYSDNIKDVLACSNEISKEVYVIDNDLDDEIKETLYEYGAIIVDKNEKLNLDSRWTLVLEEPLVLNKQNQIDILRIVNHLKSTNEIKYRGKSKIIKNS